MDLRKIGYFIVVAEEQHFSRAAVRIGIEQSPLSRAIRALERDIGVVLLERSTRGARLTPAGAVFLHHAKMIFENIESAKRATWLFAGGRSDCRNP
jgi:DNA-binding transcriptional LysR family regulator